MHPFFALHCINFCINAMNLGGTLRLNKFACFTLVFVIFLIIYWSSAATNYPSASSDLLNLKTLLKAAIHASELGGQKVADGKNYDLNVQSKGETLEGANDPVTDADYASHCAMFYGLKKAFPRIAIVSEEHVKGDLGCELEPAIDLEQELVDHRSIEYMADELVLTKDVTVWIDPLDATQEYTESLLHYVTTMVCVAIKGVPVIGVIHYPFPARTYWGWFTKKTSNNIPNVPHRNENKEAPRVVISRSHAGEVEAFAKDAFGEQTRVTRAGGAGYKVMGVVNGTFDVYLHTTAIKKWDLCAGNAIIKAVDGQMTTIKGEPIDYSENGHEKVTDGILVTRYDHEFYLSKVQNIKSDTP